jgi:nucleoside-diphosphate-sugar epimerase
MTSFGDGTYRIGAPEIWSGVVDVRDVATAHINAGFAPEASGRYITASGEATLMDITQILRKHFGKAYPWPMMQAPKFIFWMIAPLFGYTRQYASRNTGYRIKMDNSRSQSELGMAYIPFEQTVVEHFQQLIDDGILKRRQ